ncbi:response regulator transcription factor [Hydrogenovibrio kuenenii]|uniref:response regulator transcription factor n=1 Tax=Hydrogenovibrio kuenenii TaxID=63658 RepID=UPI0004631E05|nr:response regulator transcription factor [Hydrogenovibrio kuenenii]
MKLLLIEDELWLLNNLQSQLEQAGFIVDTAPDGEQAAYLINEYKYDLIVLDLGLPKKPGLVLLEEIRESKNATPVLILTARNSWQERVEGLKKGADDYLGKPFHFEELLARIEVLLKRPRTRVDDILQVGSFTLDLNTRELTTDNAVHKLTKTEFGLARLMMSEPNKVFAKDTLLQQVTDQNYDRESNVIEVYISKLRQYFGKSSIETLRGQGYRLVAPKSKGDTE